MDERPPPGRTRWSSAASTLMRRGVGAGEPFLGELLPAELQCRKGACTTPARADPTARATVRGSSNILVRS